MFQLNATDSDVLRSGSALSQVAARRIAALHIPQGRDAAAPGVFSPVYHWDVRPPFVMSAMRIDVGADSKIVEVGGVGNQALRENVWALTHGGRVLVTPATLLSESVDNRTAKNAELVDGQILGREEAPLSLRKVRFIECAFENCRFRHTRFIDCVFHDCRFVNCRFEHILLQNVDLSNSRWVDNQFTSFSISGDSRLIGLEVESGASPLTARRETSG